MQVNYSVRMQVYHVRREVIAPLGLTVTEAAKVLHVGRQALSALLNERVALSRHMALRVEKAFGPKMEHLMRMQLAYDLAQARREERAIAVKRYVAGERARALRGRQWFLSQIRFRPFADPPHAPVRPLESR